MADDGVVIGLEVHVQLNRLNSKMFCSCDTKYHNSEPNTHVCPICLGLPGCLPAINKKAVENGVKVALALNSKIQDKILFYRKNYYYPDLPRGFQISQYDYPLSLGGTVTIEGEGGERDIRLTRVHMEEDPGRLVHKGTIDRSKYSLIDYNRSGMPLLEVVTEPDLCSPKEARRFLNKLRNILEYLEVFDGNLDGALRVDANISLKGGQRAEVKNISSYKGAERALLFEISRQKNLVRRGEAVVQETRHFDEDRGITVSMRTKEESHDYRYFPEPDLVPMMISDWVKEIFDTLPELPDAKRARFREKYKISDYHAKVLTSELDLANFFEKVASKIDPVLSATWIADTLKGELNYRDDHFVALRNLSKDPRRIKQGLCKIKVESEITETLKADLIAKDKEDETITIIEVRTGAARPEDLQKLSKISEELKIKDKDQKVKKILIAPALLEETRNVIEVKEEQDTTIINMSTKEMVGDVRYDIHSINSNDIVEILNMLVDKKITDKGAVEIIRTILDDDSSGSPERIVKEKGLVKVEEDAVLGFVLEVIASNKDAVEDYRNGKKEALNFLIGQVMKKARGSADPSEVKRLILGRI